MLIGTDSLLRQLPLPLDERQARFLDAMRLAIEMSDLAYGRLHQLLLAVSRTGEASPPVVAALFLDAWAIVDQANRIRTLVSGMRGARNTPEVRLIKSKLAPAENLRNPIQHLSSELGQLTEENRAVWGWLSWWAAFDPPKEEGAVAALCYLFAGSTSPDFSAPPRRRPTELSSPIDHVALTAHGHEVALADLLQAMRRLVLRLEAGLRKVEAELEGRAASLHAEIPRRTTDLFACVEFR